MVLAQIPVFVVGILVVLFLLVSAVLILTVLIQRPMGGGLAGAFGSGAGSGQTAFGAKTGDVLTLVTIVVFATWLLGAIGLNYATRPPAPPPGAQVVPTGAQAPEPVTGEEGAAQPEGAASAQPEEAPSDQPAGDAPGEGEAGGGQEQGDAGAADEPGAADDSGGETPPVHSPGDGG